MQRKSFAEHFLSRLDISPANWKDLTGPIPVKEGILRSASFDVNEMIRHGRSISEKHAPIPGQGIADLLKDLAGHERTILEANILFADEDRIDDSTQQCDEWRSNLDLVRDQILKTRNLLLLVDKRLSRLTNGSGACYPRLYDIATELVSHTNSRIEPDILREFIHSYQKKLGLGICELKAVRALFKLCIIDNLRRIALSNVYSLVEYHFAEYWHERLATAIVLGGNDLHAAWEEIDQLLPVCSVTFLSELASRNGDHEEPENAILSKVAKTLSIRGMTIKDAHQAEKRRRFEDIGSMWNCINSLRVLDTIDWPEFVDDMSVTEKILRKDISDVYGRMDYHTRDNYRSEVARIARQTGLTEFDVADRVVRHSKQTLSSTSTDATTAHIGYFLIGAGRKIFSRSLGVRYSPKDRVANLVQRFPLFFYLGSVIAVTGMIAFGLLTTAFHDGARGWVLWIMAIMILLSSSQVALCLIDRVAAFLKRPAMLARYDFSKGIPGEFTTLVIVPAQLTSPEAITELVHDLEIRFLSNRDKNLHFGLLTDFKDSPESMSPNDELLLQFVKKEMEELNARHPVGPNGSFFLFHRPRKWNARDNIWMGFERKRGKIMELNGLLRGRGADNFSLIIGDQRLFPRIKYVISLDSDTQLPKETAWKLVATLAHPTNKAVYCPKKKRVIAGYGMLQPKMASDLRGADGSWYQKWASAGPDVDPYMRASQDIYQDLFGEGSFSGKGIYEVDVFNKVLQNRFPENRILSHDLLEGCYIRSGLLNDVKLYERFPDYLTDVSRRHRWIRGDWQIAEWVLPFVPGFAKKREKNPLSTLSRWKIFDNLRRSLVPVSLICMLFIGNFLLKSPDFWTLYVIFAALFPALALFLSILLKNPEGLLVPRRWRNAAKEASNRLWLNVYDLICLPYEALYAANAVVIAGWRVYITGKQLLLWIPARNARGTRKIGLADMFYKMWTAPMIGLLFTGCLFLYQKGALVWTTPLSMIWIFSPVMVWLMYRKRPVQGEAISDADKLILRRLARKTWAYFEDHVNEHTHWLPPDHIQEYPVRKTASYTSPTNLGLTLLSNLSAYDLGYITGPRFIERTENTLDAMDRLERFRGHFYNWYNVRTMGPVHPRYVSSVDSGNLIGHVITLQQGLLEFFDRPVVGKMLFEGLVDITLVIESESAILPFLAGIRSKLQELARSEADSLGQMKLLVDEVSSLTQCDRVDLPVGAKRWLEKLYRQVKDIKDDLSSVMPWLWATDVPSGVAQLISGQRLTPGLNHLDRLLRSVLAELECLQAGIPAGEQWSFREFKWKTEAALAEVERRKNCLLKMIAQCEKLTHYELDFLINKPEHLLSIGYNVETGGIETNNYDSLASESRLATYVAVCKNKLPVRSWFDLGRSLVHKNGEVILLSANGTMFEYLMAPLVMPELPDTLLYRTGKTALKMQIAHGMRLGIPWGVSESGYAKIDQNMNYQYKVFGVPELCLKHDHSETGTVVAPYATLLALMVDPTEACRNIKRLISMGLEGQYGMFEAVELSRADPSNISFDNIIRSFMVHHLGMGLLAVNNVLMDKIMQRRFSADPDVKTGLLLLQENIPMDSVVYPYVSLTSHAGAKSIDDAGKKSQAPDKERKGRMGAALEAELLSNGRYNVLVDGNGNGYSQWEDILITQWRSDDDLMNGIFCMLADPTGIVERKRNFRAAFFPGFAQFWCDTGAISVHARQVVSAEDDIEAREISLYNAGMSPKTVEISGYYGSDGLQEDILDHEVLNDQCAIIYKKRSGLNKEHRPWMFQQMTIEGKEPISGTFESCESAGHDRSHSHVVRFRAIIDPGSSVLVKINFGVGQDKESCKTLLKNCQHPNIFERILEAANRRTRAILDMIKISDADLDIGRQIAGRLMPTVLFSKATPTILVRVVNAESLPALLKTIRLHTYWRLNGLVVKLVIWNEDNTCYKYFSEKLISMLLSRGGGTEVLNYQSGGIFLRSPDEIPSEPHIFLQSVSCVITIGNEDSLENAIVANPVAEGMAVNY